MTASRSHPNSKDENLCMCLRILKKLIGMSSIS